MADELTDLVGRLHHAIATASNDDLTEPMSDKRQRHADRICVMREAADALTAMKAENERMREALEWYAERASSLANRDWKNNDDYALAIFAELSLDGGGRARTALRKDTP